MLQLDLTLHCLLLFYDRKLPWFGSNFALCCFGQSLADANCYLSFKFAFLRTFFFFHAFATLYKLVPNFAAFRMSRLVLLNSW